MRSSASKLRLNWTDDGRRAYLSYRRGVNPRLYAWIVYNPVLDIWRINTNDWATTDKVASSYSDARNMVEAMWALDQ